MPNEDKHSDGVGQSEFSQDVESNISKIKQDMIKAMEESNENDETYSEEEINEDSPSSEENIQNESDVKSIEEEAKSRGWKSKDELKNPDIYVSAAEYLKNSKFVEEISKLRRQSKQQDKSIKFMNDLLFKNHQISMKERADFFLSQKKVAITAGNVEEAEKYEKLHKDSIDELESVKPPEIDVEEKNKRREEDYAPEVKSFVQRNSSWFSAKDGDENFAMQSFAIQKEMKLRKENPEMGNSEIMYEIEKSIKSVFPHRFENQNRKKPSQVINPTTTTAKSIPSKKNKYSINDIPLEARREVKKLASKFNMSADDYADQLISGGYLK